MAQTQITWPKVNTAFLVIHGVGSHRPFEVLDDFTRNFLDVLRTDKNTNAKFRHELQRHNDWIESYISSYIDGIEGTPTLDFYEYYWDCYMTREIPVKELIEWIDKASDGAKYFYKYQMPELVKQYEKDKVDLFGDGEFRGYGVLLDHSRLIQWLIRLIASSPLRCITERLSRWTSLKDLVIYTTSDVRSQNYEIRRRILDGAVEELKLLLNSGRYDQIVVVGHSLGSAIAYDALDCISHDMNVSGGISPQVASKIKGLVTLGSPLDKIAFFFHERIPKENSIQRAILAHLHNFKRLPLTIDQPLKDRERTPKENSIQRAILAHLHNCRRRKLTIDQPFTDIEDPFPSKLDNCARWVNFYHKKDHISGHLDAYYVADEDNVQCEGTVPGVGIHSCYWHLEGVYDKIIQCFF